MGVRAIERARPRFLVFSPSASATSTRYLGTAINYTIVAFCAYRDAFPAIYEAPSFAIFFLPPPPFFFFRKIHSGA